ncbi:hypothetical protein [Flavobacterium foetidum]|uniref:hypothetical protein n=1 Tax=Flavobacterium foetidum TaxID=2026681 RepID=UPI001074E4C0|nr:hypothetical protein [Flavobacterium foetidum]KAF2513878.1 hypothetical protein E0W73_13705 [Flavobacterium foetidum]
MDKNFKYQLTRTCKDYQNKDVFELTKIECAFSLYNFKEIWNKECSNCFSTACYSLSKSFVAVDQEILDLWGNNEKLHLDEQDEEIILAEMDYLPLLLSSVHENKYLKRKTEILLEALCVLLYDNTVASEEFTREENKEREKNATLIRLELIRLKDQIKASEKYMMDYIKEVAFPQIGIE